MPEFRIPLAGSYNTRVGATNVISSQSGVIGQGIIGLMIIGLTGTTTSKDQRYINCFTETVLNHFTQKKAIYVVKRPGFASALTPQAGSIGNALLVWSGSANKIISAFGATNSSIYDSSTQLVTNNADTTVITGKARHISETIISSTATLAIASTDNTGWFYQPAGTVTKIADAQFPGNAGLTTVGGFAHMDGYAFIMTSNGQIWNSDLNSITSWTASGVLSANSYPDAGVGCVRLSDKIVAFGTQSTQFYFHDNNVSGSVFSRIEPLTLKVGCISADAIAEVNGVLYWVGSSPEGGLTVYSYSSGLNRISTPEIDSIILLSGAGNISMTSTKFYGRAFVIILAGSVTFVYCIEEQAWHEWSGAAPLWYKCAGVSSGNSQVTYSISKTSTAGKVFTVNPAALTFQDDGMSYALTIQTSLIGESGRRLSWNEVEILGDKQTTSSTLTVSYSDDDYQNYTNLGTVDPASGRMKLHRGGTSYRRAWVLSHSDNTPLRLESIIGQLSVGAT